MSVGYPLEMGELLLAVKAALLATSSLRYLDDVRIINGPFYAEPWSEYTIYLRPGGSPETVVALDGGRGIAKYATHSIAVDAVMRIDNPFDEDSVVGRTNERVGITAFVADICELLENNLLGLSTDSIEHGVPPVIEFPEGAFGVLEADSDIWLQSAQGIYRAQTRSFYRTGTYT